MVCSASAAAEKVCSGGTVYGNRQQAVLQAVAAKYVGEPAADDNTKTEIQQSPGGVFTAEPQPKLSPAPDFAFCAAGLIENKIGFYRP
jgi:hypothetical protein